MRAVVITRPGPPAVLEMRDVAKPAPAHRQILVRVHATALNRADLMQRRGNYPPPAGVPAEIPGLEFAGVVEACGAGARRWAPGDRVMGLVAGASYAEYVVTHEDEAVAVPASMSTLDAAAVPEAYYTAHDGFRQLDLLAGQTLLIHGVASGVGTAAVQLARLRGARVIGTSRSAWKLQRLREWGMSGDDIALIEAEHWVEDVHRLTDGRGPERILDLVGGSYLEGDLEVIALRGRILVVGLVAGATAQLDMRRLLNKRASIGGTVMRARSTAEKVEVARAFAAEALDALADGRLRPLVDEVLPLEHAAEGHDRMEANATVGKIVLQVARDVTAGALPQQR